MGSLCLERRKQPDDPLSISQQLHLCLLPLLFCAASKFSAFEGVLAQYPDFSFFFFSASARNRGFDCCFGAFLGSSWARLVLSFPWEIRGCWDLCEWSERWAWVSGAPSSFPLSILGWIDLPVSWPGVRVVFLTVARGCSWFLMLVVVSGSKKKMAFCLVCVGNLTLLWFIFLGGGILEIDFFGPFMSLGQLIKLSVGMILTKLGLPFVFGLYYCYLSKQKLNCLLEVVYLVLTRLWSMIPYAGVGIKLGYLP